LFTAVLPRPAEVDPLYDRDRNVYYTAPFLRGWAHLLFFEMSLVVGTIVIVAGHGAVATTAAAVYAVTVSGLFRVSALCHRRRWRPAVRRVLQRIDHTIILLLIAASAGPAFLLAVPGTAAVQASDLGAQHQARSTEI
jgi:hemolysin III